MKYQEFEKQIKVKLEGATENVDVDALIQGIHSNNTNGKTKFGLWLASLLTLMLIITFGYGFIKNTESQIPVDNTSNIVFATDNYNTKNIETQNTLIQKTEEQKTKENKSVETQIKEKPNLATTAPSNNSKNNIVNKSDNKIYTNTSTKKGVRTSRNNTLLSIDNSNIANVGNREIETDKIALQSNSSINTSDYKNQKLQLISNISISKNRTIDVEKIEKIEIRLTNFNDLKIKMNDPECYSFSSRASFNWKLGVEMGVSNPLKSIENTGKSNQIYDLREKYEKPLEGLSASIFTRVSRGRNPLYLKLGLSYTRIADNLEATFVTTRMDTTQGIISITQSENGDTLTIIKGDIITEITTQRKVKKHYYFHLYDVPVGLGYDFDLGFLKLGVEAGAVINVFSSTSGSILNGEDAFVDIDKSNLFKKNVGIRYYGRINLTKAISDNSHILLGAKFQYTPGTFSAEDNTIEQSYNLLGVRLGYMYGF